MTLIRKAEFALEKEIITDSFVQGIRTLGSIKFYLLLLLLFIY
jgi:hypothetical protein